MIFFSLGDCNRVRGNYKDKHLEPSVDSQSVIGVIVTFVLVIFACVRTSSSSQIGNLFPNSGLALRRERSLPPKISMASEKSLACYCFISNSREL